MNEYINANELKIELNNRIELLENGDAHPEVMKRVEGTIKGYRAALSIIDSLQQEQPEDIVTVAKAFLDALSKTPYNNKPITDAQIIVKQLLLFFENPKEYNPDAILEQPEYSSNLVDVDAVREDFMTEVYRVLDADPTNDRANTIIAAFDSLPTVSQEEQPEVGKYDCPTTPIEEAVEVTSRMQHIDDDMKPIAKFIVDYASWNLHKDEWNQPVLEVPLFRVLDALVQRGKPYCCAG